MINTVKIQGDGYLVNGTMSVPKVDGNRHYKEVQEWLLTNTPETEFTEEELMNAAILHKQNEITNSFNSDVSNITTALPHEMVSWRKQEEEAKAYMLDNTIATPFIDALMSTRNLGETKDELVNKIINNADTYENIYASLLGKFQNLSKAVSTATTVEEIDNITW